jgi:hypothetical protein
VRCGKQKDADGFADVHVEAHVADFGDGQSSLVLLPAGTPTASGETTRCAAKSSVSDGEERLLELLAAFRPAGATTSEWEKAFVATGPSASTFHRRKGELADDRDPARLDPRHR